MSSRKSWRTAGLLLAGILPAMFFGLFLAMGIPLVDMLLFGIAGALALLFVPINLVVWAILFLSLLIVGQLIYFARINQAFWIPYLLGGLLFIRLPMEASRVRDKLGKLQTTLPGFIWALYLFFCVFMISVAVNKTPPMHILVGAKNYIFLWSVVFVIAVAAITEKDLKQFIYGLLAVSFLQLPFALYQHFVVAAGRSQTFSAGAYWDSVVGSFGGNPEAGGSSGTLAVYLTVSITLALALFKRRQLDWQTTTILVICAFATILLAEIKVVFVIVPMAVALLFRAELIKNPAKAIAGLSAMVVAIAVILVTYQQIYWSEGKSKKDPIESLTNMLTLDTESGYVNYQTREVGRFASLGVWWAENSRQDNAKLLIGYGPTASRISNTIGYGDAAKKYLFALDTSSASVLLWDLGLIGLASLCAILLSGALAARRLASDARIPEFHRAVLEAIAVSLLIITVTLIYDREGVDNPAIQVLISFWLGYLLFWHRRVGLEASSNGATLSSFPLGRFNKEGTY